MILVSGIENMNYTVRKDIHINQIVQVIQKQDQKTGKLTKGVVERILTNAPHHPRGIKVKLQSGIVGRVFEIIEE